MTFISRNTLRNHYQHHEFKGQGLKIKCILCDKDFKVRNYFLQHLRIIHKGLKIEPEVVLDENEDLIPSEDIENEINSLPNSKSEQKKPISAKPKKGMWIVKLERIKVNDIDK